MKIRKLFLYIGIFLLFSNISIFSQNAILKGYELSTETLNFLKENKFNPKTQNLIIHSQQDFPFNIYLEFPAQNDEKRNLIFVFKQDDVASNNVFLKNFINHVKETQKNFNIIILFSYGENQIIKQNNFFTGTEIFLEQLELNEEYIGIYTDLASAENKIFESSKGIISSSQLIQICFNSFLKNKLLKSHQYLYTSQQHSFTFINDDNLNFFFNNSIPAIKLCLNGSEKQETKEAVFNNILEKFEPEYFGKWEQHFMLVYFNKAFKLVSESFLLGVLIFVIFIIILFLFVFGYINSFIKHDAWKNIKNVWFAAPITFLLVILSYYLGSKVAGLWNPKTIYGKIYLLIFMQFTLSAFFATVFYYFVAVYNHNFLENSIDYLVLISTFINQSIFVFFDISLFPVFLVIFITAFLILFFKNIISHIYLFLVMVFILLPYVHSFISIADGKIIYNFFLTSKIYYLCIAFILTPICLLYLRIFIKFKAKHEKKTEMILFSSGYLALIILSTVITSCIRIPVLNKRITVENDYFIHTSSENNIKIEYSDQNIFDDILRTIKIDTGKPSETCIIQVSSEKTLPIQYTDYEFSQDSGTNASFVVPYQPPQKLTFSYGTTLEKSIITVNVIYPSENSNDFISETKQIIIGEEQ